MAVASGVADPVISRLETGQRASAKAETVAKLAAALQTTSEYLLYGRGIPPSFDFGISDDDAELVAELDKWTREMDPNGPMYQSVKRLFKRGLARKRQQARETVSHPLESDQDEEVAG